MDLTGMQRIKRIVKTGRDFHCERFLASGFWEAISLWTYVETASCACGRDIKYAAALDKVYETIAVNVLKRTKGV
jgi:hypothetical protein